jgi:predicted transcriptional regulator
MKRTRLIDEVRLRRSLPSIEDRRRIREDARVSQQQIADEVGVTQATVANWEAGMTEPGDSSTLRRYVEVLRQLEDIVSIERDAERMDREAAQ